MQELKIFQGKKMKWAGSYKLLSVVTRATTLVIRYESILEPL